MDSFNRLVRFAAKAFYDDIPAATKTGKNDNRGLGVVVLDALTRRQWVRDEDLARDLSLSTKQVRRILRFFEEEKLVKRDHMKESAQIYSNAAVAATGTQGEGKMKLHTYSYCCLDYAQIYDVVRYRMHRMKKKIKDELEDRITIQQYVCPNCNRRYTALDALYLVSSEDEFFHCEHCNGELVVESDKLAAEEMGDGDDNATRRRRQKFKDLLQKFEETLRPLTDVLNRVKDLPVPDFKTLKDWKVQAYAAARSDGDANDPSKCYNGTPMPSLGETKVEVALPDFREIGANVKSENTSTPTKVLPPWMITKGMVLTDEQRGEVKQVSNVEGASAVSDDHKDLAAYYASYQKQQEGTSRQVGMKSKREYNDDDDDGDEDVEWEEGPIAGGTLDLNAKSENTTSTPTKVLPPRMIKKGMVLSDEQRVEVKNELNMEGASAASDDNEKNLQLAYLEAYYTALYQRQQELESKRKQEPVNSWWNVGLKC
ncbi:HTH TFE/IIEalpha-type domain-containing protein [Heracleum sosnowskyi]|uniref:HTH TFE/IIEalpha-type domain-containing protein n=1 Tax=Heracleum sosnowskyi TaxID=360622 RepID=A0AAD8HHF4_9APIA|nr:HTH TFE/IIEalpha-type domain-containing protein [Heracleum sosnowskyi]